MIVGIFHPVINCCGGAEWVALNIINTLKEHGHQVIILTDTRLNQDRFVNVFGRKVYVDQQVIFPLAVFRPRSFHNVYTNAIRSLLLKLKCEILIDTYSNSVLPGMDVSYIHYPLLKMVEVGLPHVRVNKIFFYPYRKFLDFSRKNLNEKLFFANSGFTAKAVKAEFKVDAHILYPPVSNSILNQSEKDFDQKRDNTVVAVARISNEKNLELIPKIAKYTSKGTSFIVMGHLDSEDALCSLRELLKKLNVSGKVKILPNVARHRLNEILLKSKVYLHTKTNEHFGISIIEAMASGCLPIVHNSGGPKEFVPKHLRYETAEEAAQKIDMAIESWSPKKANKISKYAQEFSESNFSKRFIDIFNSHCK